MTGNQTTMQAVDKANMRTSSARRTLGRMLSRAVPSAGGRDRRAQGVKARQETGSTITPAEGGLAWAHEVSASTVDALGGELQRLSDMRARADTLPAQVGSQGGWRQEWIRRRAFRRRLQARVTDSSHEICRLREHVADLQMASIEADVLRLRVGELEWALDTVREDADRVRDDALSVLSRLEEERALT